MINNEYYSAIRLDIAQLLPMKYTNVLEIGCGEGGFATTLQRPCEVWGIEPVEAAARLAQQRMDKVLIGTFETAFNDIPDHYFDLVVCNDVIEHLPDPDEFLESIKLKLRTNAYIIGSVPDVRYAWNLYDLLVKKDWKYTDSGILDRTHLKFFTEISLRRLLKIHNFDIEKFHGINSVFVSAKSPKELFFSFVFAMLIFLSFGFYQDIRFLQFAFRAKL